MIKISLENSENSGLPTACTFGFVDNRASVRSVKEKDLLDDIMWIINQDTEGIFR